MKEYDNQEAAKECCMVECPGCYSLYDDEEDALECCREEDDEEE